MTVHLVIYLVIFLPKVLHIHGIYILGCPDPHMSNVYDRMYGDLFGDTFGNFPAKSIHTAYIYICNSGQP
jgi:hypothetical protein